MSSTETALRLKIALLKYPKRIALQKVLATRDPEKLVKLQINNQSLTEPCNQTVLSVALKRGIMIPNNCRAGICGACICYINGKEQKSCYTPIEDGMIIVERRCAMTNWRQHTGDE